MATEVASLFAKVSADTSDFSRGMDQVKRDLDTAEGGMGRFGSLVGNGLKLAAGVGIAAVGALATGIGVAVNKAAEFEQGIADIGAMMNLSSAETAKLQDHIMDLGLDEKLKVSADEASGAVMALGTAGLDLQQIMKGASKATVLMANATGLKGKSGFATAASIATDVMAQFKIEAEDMNEAVSAIAGVTVASKFGIEDYALAIAQAGGVAGSVGVEFEDFNAAIAATSPSFASGSDAGTSFKTFLQRLVPTTNDAKEALIQLGLSTGEDYVTAFFDANGEMRSMEEIAENLQVAFAGLSESQKIEAASTIFGTDAMRTALALAEGGGEIITEMKAAIGNVNAEDLAAKRMDTLSGSWEIFQGVVETLTLQIGTAFLPAARGIVEWATDLVTTHKDGVIDFFSSVASIITTLITGDFTGGIFGLAEDDPWIAALFAVRDGMIAIGALITGDMTTWGEKIGTAGEAMNTALEPVREWFADEFPEAVAASRLAIAQFNTAMDGLLGADEDFELTQEQLTKFTDFLDDILGRTLAVAILRLGDFVSTIADTVKFVDAIGDGDWKRAWEAVESMQTRHATNMAAEALIWSGHMEEAMKLAGANTVKGFSDGVGENETEATGAIESMGDAVTGNFTKALEIYSPSGVFKGYGQNIVQGLIDGIDSMWQSLVAKASSLANLFPSWMRDLLGISSPSKVTHEIGQNTVEGYGAGIETGMSELVRSMGGRVRTQMSELIDSFSPSNIGMIQAEDGSWVPPSFYQPKQLNIGLTELLQSMGAFSPSPAAASSSGPITINQYFTGPVTTETIREAARTAREELRMRGA